MHYVLPTSRNCFSRAYNYITNNTYIRDLQRRVEQFRLSMQDKYGPRIYDFIFDNEKVVDGKTIYGIRIIKKFVRGERGGIQCEYQTSDMIESNPYIGIENRKVAAPSENAEWQNLRKALKVDELNLAETFKKTHDIFNRAFSSGRQDLLSGTVNGETYFISAQYDKLLFLPYFVQNMLGRPS